MKIRSQLQSVNLLSGGDTCWQVEPSISQHSLVTLPSQDEGSLGTVETILCLSKIILFKAIVC